MVSSYSRLYDNFIRPLVALKVTRNSLELPLGTIPVGVGWGWVGVGKHVVLMLSQFN